MASWIKTFFLGGEYFVPSKVHVHSSYYLLYAWNDDKNMQGEAKVGLQNLMNMGNNTKINEE